MSKAGIAFEDIKKELMQDEEFRKEYDCLRPRYEVISQLINISRLESGNYNPSLD